MNASFLPRRRRHGRPLLAAPGAGADRAAGDLRHRRGHGIGGARSGPDRGRRHLGRQDRARRVGSQQCGDGQGAAGAEGRRHRPTRISRPRGCRCSRKTRRTAPAARSRSSATAPATASRSGCATSSRSPARSTRWSAPAPPISAASISRCPTPRSCSTTPANRRSPTPAARPRSMPRPPASRSARRSASRRKARPARSRSARWPSACAASPTPVAQGEETLQVTVSVSWAIKPGP